ncbi:MAG: hypothetical protein U9N49_11585 [Campylobacterota bacterium]|nr:hypothetical protein [Campylobacterota bacterium]
MVVFYLNEPKRCNKLHPTTPYLRPKERLKAQIKQASLNVRKKSLKCVNEFEDMMNDGLSDTK